MAEIYCPDRWNAQLKLTVDPPTTIVGDSQVILSVEVTNRGRRPWQISSSEVRLGVRMAGPLDSIPENSVGLFLGRDLQVLDRARADADTGVIHPDQEENLLLSFRVPEKPGLYLIQVDMVEEHVHWFSEMGWPGLVWPVEVIEGVGEGSTVRGAG